MTIGATRLRAGAGVLGAAVLGTAVLALTSCGANAEDAEDSEPGVSVAAIQAEADTLVDEVGSFVDEKVTVSAEVERVVSGGSFTIGDDEAEHLLVRYEGDLDVAAGARVQVTGTVLRSFDPRDFPGEPAEPEPFESYTGEPFIDADRVEILGDG